MTHKVNPSGRRGCAAYSDLSMANFPFENSANEEPSAKHRHTSGGVDCKTILATLRRMTRRRFMLFTSRRPAGCDRVQNRTLLLYNLDWDPPNATVAIGPSFNSVTFNYVWGRLL